MRRLVRENADLVIEDDKENSESAKPGNASMLNSIGHVLVARKLSASPMSVKLPGVAVAAKYSMKRTLDGVYCCAPAPFHARLAELEFGMRCVAAWRHIFRHRQTRMDAGGEAY